MQCCLVRPSGTHINCSFSFQPAQDSCGKKDNPSRENKRLASTCDAASAVLAESRPRADRGPSHSAPAAQTPSWSDSGAPTTTALPSAHASGQSGLSEKSSASDERDKPRVKETTPVSPSSKSFSHDATVLHVSQDTSNMTPITALKQEESLFRPDLCYTGTEDIVSGVSLKSVTSTKSCSKTKGHKKDKNPSRNIDAPVVKKKKAAAKKLELKTAELSDGVLDVKAEKTAKKRKSVKKCKVEKEMVNGEEMLQNGETEVETICAKKRKVVKVKDPPNENNDINDNSIKDTGNERDTKGRKRKLKLENNDENSANKDVKRRKPDKKKNPKGMPKKKKKKMSAKSQEPQLPCDLPVTGEVEDADLVDPCLALTNKKPTAEALALQATVEKLQGRLTPTLHQGTNSFNGTNTESLQAVLPRFVSGLPADKESVSVKPQTDKQIVKGVTATPSNLSRKSASKGKIAAPVNGDAATGAVTGSSHDKALGLSDRTSCVNTVSQNGPVCLPSKDKSVQLTSTATDTVLNPIAQPDSVDNVKKPSVNRTPAPTVHSPSKRTKAGKARTSDTIKVSPKLANLHKAAKKDTVENTTDKLFQKRETVLSPGKKKQRIENTIDRLLAKREKNAKAKEVARDSETLTGPNPVCTESGKDNWL